MKQHRVVIDTYIYQIGPFKLRLLVRTNTIQLVLYLLGDNKSITNQEVPITGNFIG